MTATRARTTAATARRKERRLDPAGRGSEAPAPTAPVGVRDEFMSKPPFKVMTRTNHRVFHTEHDAIGGDPERFMMNSPATDTDEVSPVP